MTQAHRFLPLPFIVVFLLHQTGQLIGNSDLMQYTKPLIVPTVFLAFIFGVRALATKRALKNWKPTVQLASFGLFFSWLGDIALMIRGDMWFIIGLLMFLVAQLFYITIFLKFTRIHSSFRPWSLLYALWYAGLIMLLAPNTGNLLIPVVIYGAILTLMGLLASRSNGAILFGGLLFLLSDSILAINKFVPKDVVAIDFSGFWVMLTYSLAQALIAYGIFRHLRSTLDRQEKVSHLE